MEVKYLINISTINIMKTFVENISVLNNLADNYIKEDGFRPVETMLIRAFRTMINPKDNISLKDKDPQDVLNEVLQTMIYFIRDNDIDYKWILNRIPALSEYTKEEIDALKNTINVIKGK